MPDNQRRSYSSGDASSRRRSVPGAGRRPSNDSRPPSGAPRKRIGRPKTRWWRAISMVAITVGLCFVFAILILRGASDLFGLQQKDLPITVVIPEGANWNKVSDVLRNADIIEQKLTFRLYVGSKKDSEGNAYVVKPGEYPLNSNMGYDQIISFLRTGNTANDEVRLTFIEGMSLAEIAAILEENGVCTAQDLFDYLENAEINYSFYNDLQPMDPLRFRSLEGYLFPDTYDFFVNEKVSSVVDKFLANFSAQISYDMEKRMKDLGMTLDEAVTLASVIQREAGTPSEMRKVSAVFHNRLNAPQDFPRLQSDVTLFYAEEDIKPFLPNQQEVYDAYNTYVRQGLPIGPICNPGLEAITAALYPAENGFYYFVTDVEGNYYYAANLQKHNSNIAEAASVDKANGSVHGINTPQA